MVVSHLNDLYVAAYRKKKNATRSIVSSSCYKYRTDGQVTTKKHGVLGLLRSISTANLSSYASQNNDKPNNRPHFWFFKLLKHFKIMFLDVYWSVQRENDLTMCFYGLFATTLVWTLHRFTLISKKTHLNHNCNLAKQARRGKSPEIIGFPSRLGWLLGHMGQ